MKITLPTDPLVACAIGKDEVLGQSLCVTSCKNDYSHRLLFNGVQLMKFAIKTVAACALFACAGVTFAQKGETVKIAFIDPLSGPFANVGQNQLKSWQFVADRLAAQKTRPV